MLQGEKVTEKKLLRKNIAEQKIMLKKNDDKQKYCKEKMLLIQKLSLN